MRMQNDKLSILYYRMYASVLVQSPEITDRAEATCMLIHRLEQSWDWRTQFSYSYHFGLALHWYGTRIQIHISHTHHYKSSHTLSEHLALCNSTCLLSYHTAQVSFQFNQPDHFRAEYDDLKSKMKLAVQKQWLQNLVFSLPQNYDSLQNGHITHSKSECAKFHSHGITESRSKPPQVYPYTQASIHMINRNPAINDWYHISTQP